MYFKKNKVGNAHLHLQPVPLHSEAEHGTRQGFLDMYESLNSSHWSLSKCLRESMCLTQPCALVFMLRLLKENKKNEYVRQGLYLAHIL